VVARLAVVAIDVNVNLRAVDVNVTRVVAAIDVNSQKTHET
jgi:hypothetical protein